MAVAVDGGEARLVAEARRGDASAFDALAEQHRRGLYQLARRWLRDPELALDCVQETLLRAYASLPRFREQCSFSTWLYRIHEHVCAEEQRRRERQSRVPLAHLWERAPDVEAVLARRADLDDALRALADLPLTLRTTALLGLVEGRTSSEVGGLLGISVEAAKMRLSRARALIAAAPASLRESSAVRDLLAEGYRELASLVLRQGREEEAGEALRRSVQLDPEQGGYYAWEWHYARRGTPWAAAARRQVWRVLAEADTRPELTGTALGLAEMHHWEGGDPAVAERLYRSLLSRRNTDGINAHGLLGMLYRGLGRYREALPWFAARIELGHGTADGHVIGHAAYCLARCRQSAAREWARRTRAMAMNPEKAWGPTLDRIQAGNIHCLAAVALEAVGEAAKARQHVVAASKAFPAEFRDADATFLSLTSRLLRGTWPRRRGASRVP